MRLPLFPLVSVGLFSSICLPSLPAQNYLPETISSSSLSAAGLSNPLIDPRQAKDELLALTLYKSSQAQEAEQVIAGQWLSLVKPLSPASYTSFPEALKSLTFAYTVVATDEDADTPHIVHLEAQTHSVNEVQIPGTLDLLNNPDVIYRRATLNSDASYVITGQRSPVPPVDDSFSILNQAHLTVANLSGNTLVTAPDGSFTITLDNTPSAGRANHLQLPAGLSQLLIRDTLSDQTTQRPNRLEIARVSGPPPAAPPTLNDMKARVAGSIAEGYSFLVGLNRLIEASGVNIFAQPVVRTGGGELITQANSTGHVVLGDDEALVLTLRPGGAAYMTVAATNVWQAKMDFVDHTTSLNDRQAIANPDGTYTFVLSIKDPGVHNWIDPVGVHETIVQPRWQGLSAAVPSTGGPAITSQAVVKLSQLQNWLPAGTVYVTPAERAVQIRQRVQSFAWRRPTG